jgi:hypothetical protein
MAARFRPYIMGMPRLSPEIPAQNRMYGELVDLQEAAGRLFAALVRRSRRLRREIPAQNQPDVGLVDSREAAARC